MSSLPLRQKQLGLEDSKHPEFNGNKGFEVESGKAKPLYRYEDWEGTVKGKTKHTYKAED